MSNYSQFIGGGAGTSGASGYSGASGGTGSNGTSGYSGAVGPAGSTGTSGYSGISGWSGSAGSTSLTSTYVAFGSGSNTITGSVQLTWDDTSRILTVGSLTHGNGTTIIGQTQNTGVGVPGTLVVSGAVGNSSGGDLVIKGGQSGGSVPGGNLYIQAGNSLREGDGGSNTGPTLYLRAGTGGGAYPNPGSIVFETSNLGDVPQVYVERMRMRGTGALSFGSTGSAYGTSGWFLMSTGDSPPVWSSNSGFSGIAGSSGFSGFSGVTQDLSSYVTLTGTQTITNKTYTGVKETKVAMAANDVDLSLGNYYTKTATTTTTFTASNVPASGTTGSFVLELTNGGSQTINWFTGTTWASGVAPTLTAAGVDVLGFYTFDGGSTWRGLTLALDIK